MVQIIVITNRENNIVINFNPTINVNGNENIGETVKEELRNNCRECTSI